MSLKDKIYIAGGVIGSIGASVGLAVLLNNPIYQGQIDHPGVKRVEVSPEYTFGVRVDSLKRYGNLIEIMFSDGTVLSFRDFNGDFKNNGDDTVVPANTVNQDELTKILEKTRIKVKETESKRENIQLIHF